MTTQQGHRSTALRSSLAVCVWIPIFSLRCEEARRPELRHRPAALLSPTDTRRIWQVSPTGWRAGVRPGMTVSQAIGLCPSLTLCESDPVHYDEQSTRLLLALEGVSPIVEPAELGRVFVGVDGLGGLYGGPARQIEAVERALWRYGGLTADGCGVPSHPASPPHCRLGWARGKFVAWVAATRAKPGAPVIVPDESHAAFLAGQPIAVLPIGADTHHRLRQLGLETLADVARLPEPAMVSQFGAEGRRAWRLATGAADDPVVGRERPEPIAATLDFPAPTAARSVLVHALSALIERALARPQRTGWRVQTVRAHAALEYGTSWMVEVTLKDPSANCERIASPLRTRLDLMPPAGAVERLTVEFTGFARGTDELQLFARDAPSAARAGQRRALQTAAREITTRFKRSRLYHIVEVQPWSRIPERRYALIDFDS